MTALIQHGSALFRDYSLEITGKDIWQIEAAKSEIPAGTPINIAYLGNESHAQRIEAAARIRQWGFEPVPIISSRRLRSVQDRDELLTGLISAARPARFMFVGGDPSSPTGPYKDSLDLIAGGIVADHGIVNVGIAGYPEGHPKIDQARLWEALGQKTELLKARGCSVEITTQFGFDADAVVDWIAQVRARGIDAPIRIGVPGPADVKRLLRFAAQFGVASSAAIVGKYGFSLANLVNKVGPDRFMSRLAGGMAGRDLGTVMLHLYPFGGIADTVAWAARAAGRQTNESVGALDRPRYY
ncbi:MULTISPECIES: methylenetetrahydrofolate reductase [Ensifer]|uniref:methylenetetrahydrofolate reductase n=1 Tax=Ensifer TaxID=106591 RepID=UPI0007C89D4F|nr:MULTISPECIES: methylenetetrahydrofolate reductase [Ensifer]MDP9633292.1 methylenetetrahydrofolate reductase (NADPH) [Ensifer adhaerens]MBD9490734.1 methylenetetrahydrofolate reductase [Ensifer sp. ENS11]NOV19558.1 methylenetetrahydrofolate reductase [Ensifer canadensis]OMQ42415.1 methylenetetrahydrofolate reductase [Ensifer sp. 1H6]PSS62860.1 methylenetetrahydrofolate reductase [Ensifer sp. NM-2]